MTPLLNNVYTIQFELFDQWYKSCHSARNTFNSLIDTSHDLISHVTRQQQDNIDDFLESLKASTKPFPAHRKKTITGTSLVTGGIGGIGTAICRRLALNENRIISTYIPAERDKALEWKRRLQGEGLEVEVLECDVTDFEACQVLAETVKNEFGTPEILVNAAGITRDALLRKMSPEKWDAVMNTNLDSVFNITRCFIRGMIKNGYGRIINISSVNGQRGQFGQTNYSTAKAGMIGFTRSLALELADKGITANCVCPGYVGTPMVEAIRQDVLDGIIAQIPVGRLASTDEIAHAVAFLADRNSSYITGTELAVNGGLWMG